jgi:hypothetical protein
MDIVPLTLVISLCLTFTFIVFFAREQARRRFGSAESESLLPLLDEQHVTPAAPVAAPAIVIDMSKARTRCKNHHECPRAGNCEHKEHPHGAYPEAHA